MRSVHARGGRGFTLVELLVVIAVVAVLVGVLLPALAGARKTAQGLVVSNNMRSVALAVNSYGGQNGLYPASYVYGSRYDGGGWKLSDQQESHPDAAKGYVHWSYALFDDLDSESEAFQSPLVPNGGAPATNPGPDAKDWEPEQENDLGQTCCAEDPEDRQVKRCAFTGNHAIFPRNKFATNTLRNNRLVRPGWIDRPTDTILATEFLYRNNWKSLRSGLDGKIKSHRPVTPFNPLAAADVYGEATGGTRERYTYPRESELLDFDDLGDNMIDSGASPLNAVARHHPNQETMFVFVDGHVETTTLIETVRERRWGDRFYSITGTPNKVVSPTR